MEAQPERPMRPFLSLRREEAANDALAASQTDAIGRTVLRSFTTAHICFTGENRSGALQDYKKTGNQMYEERAGIRMSVQKDKNAGITTIDFLIPSDTDPKIITYAKEILEELPGWAHDSKDTGEHQ
jgi:hypothetical protein